MGNLKHISLSVDKEKMQSQNNYKNPLWNGTINKLCHPDETRTELTTGQYIYKKRL